MENINFIPEYVSHMRKEFKETFIFKKTRKKVKKVLDNTKLLNFLLS